MGYQQTSILDVTHLINRELLIPKIGLSYTDIPELNTIVTWLNNWQFETALNQLDILISEGRHQVDALLLKGEVLALFEENYIAIEVFNEVLKKDAGNVYALIGRLIQLDRIQAEQSEIYHTQSKLKQVSSKVHDYFVETKTFMNTHKDSFNKHCQIDDIDTICVCGYFLHSDGSLPTKLQSRLNKVIELANRSKEVKIVLSGGAVQNQYSEAEAMKNYLIGAGIAPNRIVTYNQARDTVGNVMEFVDYLRNNLSKRACVITSKDHLPRAWMSLSIGLSKAGLAIDLYGDAPNEQVDQNMIVKEHQLNYQTLFRVAGLFEKREISKMLS